MHARGAAAHGVFQVYEDLSELTCAQLLRDPKVQTPVFVRFSTTSRLSRFGRYAARRRGFAVEVLYTRRRLGLGWQ